jgi:predicted nucleic acid-binding protein
MNYVLDSSVAFKWVVPETNSDKAERLRDDYRATVHELISPGIFTAELAHALTRAERQGRIAVGQALILWSEVMRDAPVLYPTDPLIPRAIAIASAARVGVYDCLYVALAEREGCDLVTADDKLVKNLQPSFPFITSFTSL